MASSSVWLVHVVPSFGNLLASIMLISPVPAVLKLRVTGKLGDLNPLPLPLTAYNGMGWLSYGFATANPYLFPSNLIGFVAGVFFTLTAHAVANRPIQDRIMGISVTAAIHFLVMGMIALFGLSKDAATQMWGINAIVILMVYYLIPLSTMYEIVKKKNAISIYPPLAIAAIANGGLWTVYGFALGDVNLWLPNLFGAVLGVVQLLLRLVFGAVPEPPPGTPLLPTSVAAGAGVPGGKGGPAEAPERHPSAKHPGAKETRRASILSLLNPYHFHSHAHPPEDATEKASGPASSAGSESGPAGGGGGGGIAMLQLSSGASGGAASPGPLSGGAKPTTTTAVPTATGKAAAKPVAD